MMSTKCLHVNKDIDTNSTEQNVPLVSARRPLFWTCTCPRAACALLSRLGNKTSSLSSLPLVSSSLLFPPPSDDSKWNYFLSPTTDLLRVLGIAAFISSFFFLLCLLSTLAPAPEQIARMPSTCSLRERAIFRIELLILDRQNPYSSDKELKSLLLLCHGSVHIY